MVVSWIQVLGSGSAEAPPVLLVGVEQYRMLINCPEGLQRMAMEHQAKLSRVSHVLFTSTEYRSLGGLPGALLTLADVGVQHMKIHGPLGLGKFMIAASAFVYRENFKLTVTEQVVKMASFDVLLGDSASASSSSKKKLKATDESLGLKVTSFCISVNSDSSLEEGVHEHEGQGHPSQFREERGLTMDISRYKSEDDPQKATTCSKESALATQLQPTPAGQTSAFPSISYVLDFPGQRGKFHPERAKALGVPPGPNFGKLTKGQAVTVEGENGQHTVYPEQCKDPDLPPRSAFVLSCPTFEHFLGLSTSETFHATVHERIYSRQGANADANTDTECMHYNIPIVFHLCPSKVVCDMRYHQWIKDTFPQSTAHIVVNQQFSGSLPIYRGATLQQIGLNVINPKIFPLPFPLKRNIVDMARVAELIGEKKSNTSFLENLKKRATSSTTGHMNEKRRKSSRTSESTASITTEKKVNGNVNLSTMRDTCYCINDLLCDKNSDRTFIGRSPLLKIQLTPSKSEGFDLTDIWDKSRLVEETKSFLVNMLSKESMKDITPVLLNLRYGDSPGLSEATDSGNKSFGATLASIGIGGSVKASTQTEKDTHDSAKVSSMPPALSLDGRSELSGKVAGKLNESLCTLPSESKVIFLGTGSAMPSKYRNVTAIYFELTEGKAVLLDAGENTYGQLFRRFGTRKTRLDLPNGTSVSLTRLEYVLLSFQLVWISHMHADHHLGLPRIMIEREKVISKVQELSGSKCVLPRCCIVGPPQLGIWLSHIKTVVPGINDSWDFVSCTRLMELCDRENSQVGCLQVSNDCTVEDLQPLTTVLSDYQLHDLAICPVIHCPHAYAFRISGFRSVNGKENKWSLVYSGDCSPCDSLLELGQNCSLLIHEATFEDGMEQEAVGRSHSTVTQAVEQGAKMNAKAILLTHFSARYPKIPVIKSGAQVCVGYDLMTVKPEQLPSLHRLLPILHAMYEEEEEEDGSFAQG